MVSLVQLRNSVAEALAYLRTIDDIEEAEVFASSNGQLLTRLNYTSHIPCNGVEEPKSTEAFGIGIQAVFKTPEGRKIGFGSESSDISLDGAKEALAKARLGAVSADEPVQVVMVGKHSIVPAGCILHPGAVVATDVIPEDYPSGEIDGEGYIQTHRLAYEV